MQLQVIHNDILNFQNIYPFDVGQKKVSKHLIVFYSFRITNKNKTQFHPSSGRVDTAIWMHYMDAN